MWCLPRALGLETLGVCGFFWREFSADGLGLSRAPPADRQIRRADVFGVAVIDHPPHIVGGQVLVDVRLAPTSGAKADIS